MYKIKVNGDHQFNVDEQQIEAMDCIETSPKKYHILQENTTINSEVISSDFNHKSYSVKVNNNVYDVRINDAFFKFY